ncbi:MAG: M13 family metallopeptidase [Lysobacteraceae bacterium]
MPSPSVRFRALPLFAALTVTLPAAFAADSAATPQPCDDFAVWAATQRGENANLDPFAILDANSRSTQVALLQRAASSPTNDGQRLLGNLWASAASEQKHGIDALKPLLDRVAAIRRPRDVADLLGSAQQQGLPLLFRVDVAADLRDASQSMLYLRQGGLGLPDRDYYLRQDPQTLALMQHYRAYVERLLSLSGDAKAAKADAERILGMETQLARASLSLGQLRDPNNSYLPTEIKALDKQYAALGFKDFFRSLGLRGLTAASMAHTAFFVQANHLMASGSMDAWRAYLRFHLIHSMAPWLGGDTATAYREFFGVQLQGHDEVIDAEQRALAAVQQLMPELLSREFLAQSDSERLAAARALIDAEVATLRQALADADWLSNEARDAGAEKLDALLIEVGGDKGGIDTGGLAFSREHLARNALQIAAWRQRSALTRIGRPPTVATVAAQTPAAFYDPTHNRLQISAAFAAPPLFGPAMSPAAQHGGFGALIAHELSHGFDLAGSKFDAQGRTRPWWTQPDYIAYAKRNEPLSVQFDGYREQGVAIDGKRSYIENAADLAGLELAWATYRAADNEAEDKTPDRAFFTAWAALWPASSGMLDTDGLQAPALLRINGPLANLDAFAATFACEAGAGFMKAPEKRVRIWAK